MLLKALTSLAALAALVHGNPMRQHFISQSPLLSAIDVEAIPNNYIVVFKDYVQPGLDSFRNHFNFISSYIATHNGATENNKLTHVYEHGIVGYAGQFDDDLLENIRNAPEVDYIERDQIVYASDTQRNAPWGLARISHREPLNLSTFNKYVHAPDGGQGVTVYVVDTGVNVQHVDFEGRAKWGKTIPTNDPDEDGNGHGTHVAGTIGGKTYGVAKKAEIVAVKVLRSNGSGSMSDVVKGVEYTLTDHKTRVLRALKSGSDKPRSVANMSLGGGFSRPLNAAVDAAVSAGVHFAVAAGNDNRDACSYSPASAATAITVGSTDLLDRRSSFSNWGECVSVFAPGRNILSTWIGSKRSTNTISGTSMASPHVAGLAAYLLSVEDLTPAELKKKIIATGTTGVLTDIKEGSPNVLIYNSPPDNFKAL